MKLLNLRLLTVYSRKAVQNIDSLSFNRNFHAYYRPIHLKCVRNYCAMTLYRPTTNAFRYEYESVELLEKLKSLTKITVISSADNNVKIEELLKNLQEQNFHSYEDIQAIVTAVILAAKINQNVGSIFEKTFGADAGVKFLAHCDIWMDQMTADDAVSTLVALNLLKIPLHDRVNRKLTTHVTNMLRGNFNREIETTENQTFD